MHHDGSTALARRILRRDQVSKKTGYSSATIYRLEKRGEFPSRVQLGPNSVGWWEHEVDAWLANRPRASAIKGPRRRADG